MTGPATCGSLADCTSKIRYVTHNGAGPVTSFNPSWSPAGTRIAFTNVLPPEPGQPGHQRHLDGATQRRRPPSRLALAAVRVPARLGSRSLTFKASQEGGTRVKDQQHAGSRSARPCC
jgi:Tol biopolymer transport system component